MRAIWPAALLASALLALALASPGEAHAITTVPPGWPLIPSGLGEGDQFRLLIITFHMENLYNLRSVEKLDEYVADALKEVTGYVNHSHIRPYADEFKAVASCGRTDARHHTSTTYTSQDRGVPIYWLNGAKVADDYRDFWDGGWDSNDPRNERGTGWPGRVNTVWTGTNADGSTSGNSVCGSIITVGSPSTQGKELNSRLQRMSYHGHVYGLSPVFLVSHAPSPPGTPVVSDITHNSASLRWSAPIHSGTTAIFDYNVQIKRATDSSWVGSTPYHWGTHTNHTLTGLSPNTEYQVRVFAKNHGAGGSDTGYGPVSPVATFRTLTTVPSAPGTPTVTPSDTSAVVTWTAPAWPGNPPLHDYDMTVRPAPSVPVGVHGTGTTLTLAGLEPDTVYEVQVRANNSAGHSPWSPVAAFRTLPPSSTVPADWPLVPSGLGEGDSFRLLFVTYGSTNAASCCISTYNNFVQGQLSRNGHDAIREYSGDFRAVVSDRWTDAITHTFTQHTYSDRGLPIYWLGGNKVADNYRDFWDGSWDSGISRDQKGNRVWGEAWTGTKSDGTRDRFAVGERFVMTGNVGSLSQMIEFHEIRSTKTHHVYGISPIFLVG